MRWASGSVLDLMSDHSWLIVRGEDYLLVLNPSIPFPNGPSSLRGLDDIEPSLSGRRNLSLRLSLGSLRYWRVLLSWRILLSWLLMLLLLPMKVSSASTHLVCHLLSRIVAKTAHIPKPKTWRLSSTTSLSSASSCSPLSGSQPRTSSLRRLLLELHGRSISRTSQPFVFVSSDFHHSMCQ